VLKKAYDAIVHKQRRADEDVKATTWDVTLLARILYFVEAATGSPQKPLKDDTKGPPGSWRGAKAEVCDKHKVLYTAVHICAALSTPHILQCTTFVFVCIRCSTYIVYCAFCCLLCCMAMPTTHRH
jgi:hypothetical protein